MPIRIIRDPNRPFNWYDSIPAKRDPTQLPKDPHDQYQVDPDFFDPDVLEVNEFRQGHNVIAKIPNIEGRITRKQSNGTTYIELIVARWYDKEKKQTRNRRVTIGVDIRGIYRGMMMANENYHEYFDTKGNLVKAIQLEGENGPEPTPDQKTPEANTIATPKANTTKNTTENKKTNTTANTNPNKTADTTKAEPNKTATTTANTKPDRAATTGANKTESTATDTETKKKTTNATTGTAATPKPKKAAPVKIPKQLLAEMVKMLDQKQQIERSKHPFLNTDTEESPQMSHDLNEDELNPEIQRQLEEQEKRQIKHDHDRIVFMENLLDRYRYTIEEQAKKRPDKYLTLYQTRKINELLNTIRKFFWEAETFPYLDLAEEPTEGKTNTGTTYGDMAILLSAYDCTFTAWRLQELWLRPQSEQKQDTESKEEAEREEKAEEKE